MMRVGAQECFIPNAGKNGLATISFRMTKTDLSPPCQVPFRAAQSSEAYVAWLLGNAASCERC